VCLGFVVGFVVDFMVSVCRFKLVWFCGWWCNGIVVGCIVCGCWLLLVLVGFILGTTLFLFCCWLVCWVFGCGSGCCYYGWLTYPCDLL